MSYGKIEMAMILQSERCTPRTPVHTQNTHKFAPFISTKTRKKKEEKKEKKGWCSKKQPKEPSVLFLHDPLVAFEGLARPQSMKDSC